MAGVTNRSTTLSNVRCGFDMATLTSISVLSFQCLGLESVRVLLPELLGSE